MAKRVERLILHSLALKVSTDGVSLIVEGRRFHPATVLDIEEYLWQFFLAVGCVNNLRTFNCLQYFLLHGSYDAHQC